MKQCIVMLGILLTVASIEQSCGCRDAMKAGTGILLGTEILFSLTLGVKGLEGSGRVSSGQSRMDMRKFINLEPDPNVPKGEEDFDWSFCKKKLRIAFHIQPPFIIVDPTKCIPDPDDRNAARVCPPDAFGDKPTKENNDRPEFEGGGGLTYDLLMNHVLPRLKEYCNPKELDSNTTSEANSTQPEILELDWYLIPADFTSSDGALALLCNGKWTVADMTSSLNRSRPNCPSSESYQGATILSNVTCMSALDKTCKSAGPDLAAGALSITAARMDSLDFTNPFFLNRQTVIIRAPEYSMDISGYFNIFLPFGINLWIAIFVEVLVVWIMILIVEAPVNDQLAPEWEDRYYDAFYWSFGSLMDPGGPGKGPITWGGKLLLIGHWFFVTIVAATYTGAVGAFLATSSATPTVQGYFSLQEGLFGVVVDGPSWNSTSEEPDYRGNYKGGVSFPGYRRSRQFDIIQNTLKASSAATFQVYTTQSTETYTKDGLLVENEGSSVCKRKDVILGSYDYLLCVAGDGVLEPQAMFHEIASANYLLAKRKASSGGACPLIRVGPTFNPSGVGFAFPKTSLYSAVFSRAIQEVMEQGELRDLEEKYKLEASECEQTIEEGGDIITVEQISGLFVITMVMIGIALVHGVLTQIYCPYPKGYEVPVYEENLSQWSDVPEEGLTERMQALKTYANRVERLSGEVMEALKTGTPFTYDPDANDDDEPPKRMVEFPDDVAVAGPLSELIQFQLPFGL